MPPSEVVLSRGGAKAKDLLGGTFKPFCLITLLLYGRSELGEPEISWPTYDHRRNLKVGVDGLIVGMPSQTIRKLLGLTATGATCGVDFPGSPLTVKRRFCAAEELPCEGPWVTVQRCAACPARGLLLLLLLRLQKDKK